jgi:ribosomal protein S18 acetylase RimI-like enzyme
LNGIETVGLNVRADNDAAIRVYESLGFVRHCQFYEAVAHAD